MRSAANPIRGLHDAGMHPRPLHAPERNAFLAHKEWKRNRPERNLFERGTHEASPPPRSGLQLASIGGGEAVTKLIPPRVSNLHFELAWRNMNKKKNEYSQSAIHHRVASTYDCCKQIFKPVIRRHDFLHI